METISKTEIIGRLDAIIDIFEITAKHSPKGLMIDIDIETLKRLRNDIKLKKVV